jgi:hypothetical protein
MGRRQDRSGNNPWHFAGHEAEWPGRRKRAGWSRLFRFRLGGGFLANVGQWEQTVIGPDGQSATYQVRTTEILKRQGGVLVYVVDHASIGLPPPPPPATTGEGR